MGWVPTGGGTDADAIHDNVSGEISAVTEKTSPVSTDLLLIEDSAASNAKKRVQIGNLPPSGAGGATLASTTLTDDTAAVLDTWEQWGTEEVTITDPGGAVAVWAVVTGTVHWETASASRRLAEVRVGISFDNGSTWQYGQVPRQEIRGADTRHTTWAAQTFRSGTPTANIQVRAEIQQVNLGVAGDLDFEDGTLTVLMT